MNTITNRSPTAVRYAALLLVKCSRSTPGDLSREPVRSAINRKAAILTGSVIVKCESGD